MKHVFVINPKAGKKNYVEYITEKLEQYNGKLDYEIYVTKAVGDAKEFVRNYLMNYQDEIRIYSCGGDGTLNEVLNGMVGYKNASLACFACGSGNDFVKNYGKVEDFLDIDELINGEEHVIDLMKVGGNYCLNICNFGFDSEVCEVMASYKKIPLVSGKMAYNLGVIHCLLFRMKHYIKLSIDDELLFDGEALLCAVANGICYGGGYYCAPTAKVDDGLLDICMIKKISLFKAAPLVKIYKAGEHLDSDKVKDYIIFKRVRKVKVESKKGISYTIDGEVSRTKLLEIDIIDKGIRVIIPKKLSKNDV